MMKIKVIRTVRMEISPTEVALIAEGLDRLGRGEVGYISDVDRAQAKHMHDVFRSIQHELNNDSMA